MKIIVCIKQVPDTTEVEIDPETNTLIRSGIPVIINPDDKSGIEAALALRDLIGDSTVTVVSMGPPKAEIALREALSMGCDDAVLISGREFGGSDTLATSTILAATIKKIGFDLIITGRQAIDGDTAQVGPQIAEHLGIPQISYVEDIQVEGDMLVVRKQFEEKYQIIEAMPPVLLTALAELNAPRYMSVGGIFDAYREKEVQVWTLETLAEYVDPANLGLKGSPTRVIKSFTKSAKALGQLHEVPADEAVAIIIEKLSEKYVI